MIVVRSAGRAALPAPEDTTGHSRHTGTAR
jgi:hypothetical protein